MKKSDLEKSVKVALYTRVSTEDQAREGYSLSVQKEYLVNFANQQGWEIHFADKKGKIYTDDGYSGYTLDRPALNQLLHDARAKKFDLILVYKLDRFSRRLKDFLNVLDEFETLGVEFKSATEPYDTTTSSGKLMIQQLGSFAEFERNRIIERVFPGMVKGVQEGNWQGARYAPFGYRYDKEKKRLEIVPEEARLVREIFSKYLSGIPTQKIAGNLFERRIETRSGGFFSSSLVRKILRNKIYIGKIVWNAHCYDRKQKTGKGYRYVKNDPSKIVEAQGRHEAIVPEEDFFRAQAILDKNRRGSYIKQRKNEYPLSGLITCGKCDAVYNGVSNVSNHKTGEKARYYRCSARARYDVKCGNGDVKADLIEAQVFEILEIIFSSHDIVKKRFKNLIVDKNQNSVNPEVKAELEALKRELNQSILKQKKLTDAYLEGTISREVFQAKNLELRNEEGELRIRIERKELQLIEKEESQEYIRRAEHVVKSIQSVKEALDPLTKREFLRLIFRKLVLDDRKLKSFELYEPFNTIYQSQKGENTWNLKKHKHFQLKSRRQSCLLSPTAAK